MRLGKKGGWEGTGISGLYRLSISGGRLVAGTWVWTFTAPPCGLIA